MGRTNGQMKCYAGLEYIYVYSCYVTYYIFESALHTSTCYKQSDGTDRPLSILKYDIHEDILIINS